MRRCFPGDKEAKKGKPREEVQRRRENDLEVVREEDENAEGMLDSEGEEAVRD